MNLHGVVRRAINTVNPEFIGNWLQSSGSTTNANFTRDPTYTTFTGVRMQIQALSAKALAHIEGQNLQGVFRSVRMFGNAQGVVRVDAKGGDLLQFPQARGGPIYTWLIVAVFETWSVENGGWSSVAAQLQTDK